MYHFKTNILCLIILIGALLVSTASLSDTIQKTDAQRIKDVHKIAEMVEKFKAKTGYYPYQEAYLNPGKGYSPVPGGVTIHSGNVPKEYQSPPPGRSGRIFSYKDFKLYLESAIGPVDLPSDDRPLIFAPPYHVTCYQYLFNGKAYFVSAILEKPTKHTMKLAKGFHKYQVSSISVLKYKIYKYNELNRKH